jgi:hypothetical protein
MSELTEKEIRKLIERSSKARAYKAFVQWSKGMTKETATGSPYWYAETKYLNHKVYLDEHTHYYDTATSEVKLKETKNEKEI